MNIITIIITTITYIITCYLYYISPINLLSFLITVDGVLTASLFLSYHICESQKNQIIDNYNSLYKVTSIERYIYYIILTILFYILTIFFWIDTNIIKYIFCLSAHPLIVNTLCNKYPFNNIIKYIYECCEDLMKLLCAIQITVVMRDIAEYICRKKCEINTIDIYNSLFKDPYFKIPLEECIKNFITILLLTFLKKHYRKFYKYFKGVYNLKYGKINENPIKYLQNIIENKKWYMLHDTNTMHIIIKIIEENPDKYIGNKIFNEFKYDIFKCTSIWTISSYLNSIYYIFILFNIFLLYEFKKKYNNIIIKRIILITISTIIGILTENYILAILICYLSKFIKFNIYNIITYCINILKKIHFKIELFEFLLLAIFIILYKNSVGIPLLLCITSNNARILYLCLLFIGSLSNYNIFHILFISYIMFIVLQQFNQHQHCYLEHFY